MLTWRRLYGKEPLSEKDNLMSPLRGKLFRLAVKPRDVQCALSKRQHGTYHNLHYIINCHDASYY